jgi:hypothetical protein
MGPPAGGLNVPGAGRPRRVNVLHVVGARPRRSGPKADGTAYGWLRE